jgi:hypothetical protein
MTIAPRDIMQHDTGNLGIPKVYRIGLEFGEEKIRTKIVLKPWK